MHVLLIDTDRCGLDFAWRCVEAGHDVRWYNRDKEGNKFKDGNGFPGIVKIDDWKASMKWAKDGLIWLSSNAMFLKEMDEWKRHGYPIFAPSQAAADLEIKRAKGMRLLEKLDLLVPAYHTFNSLKEAENFARKSDQAYVFKTMGDNEDKSLSYVAKTPADLVGRIQRWIKLGLNPKGQVMLQEKIDGFEMGVSCWFGPNGPLPDKWNINFEHKKLMPGNYGPNCFTPDAEVLTRNGWKFWPDVTLEDEICTLIDGQISYEKPSKITNEPFDGSLIGWSSPFTDILVTPGHNMYVTDSHARGNMRFESAYKTVQKKRKYMYAGGEWGDFDEPEKEKLAAFLGIYIADGNVHRYEVVFGNLPEHKKLEYQGILNAIGYRFKFRKNDLIVSQCPIMKDLINLGKAHEKYVPHWIKESSRTVIREFLNGYALGDGTRREGGLTCTTVSKRLADDVQELALKAGWAAAIQVRDRRGQSHQIKGYTCTNKRVSYDIRIRKVRKMGTLNPEFSYTVPYSGRVYCVTVSSHVIYTRRNGKPAWIGQTGEMGTVCQYCEQEKMADELFTPALVKHLISIGQLGDIDLNCIVEKGTGKIYPLEFTCRPGWPYDWIAADLHKGDPVEWMRDLLDGHDTLKVSHNVAIGEIVAIPPFPRDDCDEAECMDLPVHLPKRWDRIHPVCMQIEEGPAMRDNKVIDTQIFTTTGNYVLIATGLGDTVKEAKQSVDALIKKVNVSNMMVRNDIGDGLETCLPELHKFGFATSMEFDV